MDRLRIEMRHVDAEFDRLPRRFGHGEGAEHSVKQRQAIAEIAVMMFGRDRMVDLVMCGPEYPAAPTWAECHPQMRMLEVRNHDAGEQHHDVGTK